MEWKEVLKSLLEKHEITAAELSRRSKVHEGTISRYLSGERKKPSFPELVKIADALGEPMLGGNRTVEQGMVAAKARRDPEVEQFVREWQGLPDEGRELTREFVRVLGAWSGKRGKRTPDLSITRIEGQYYQPGRGHQIMEKAEDYKTQEKG